jgi:UDP-N-acetylglucosamine 2-epimerase (non-hydrolysing)/GDP/UDP-N,N'-diacetylbacillosamine 2-epimerase (hydrolysing)
MRSVLRAIAGHPPLSLQIIATGMHLSKQHGHSLRTIRADGWKIDATVPWPTGDQTQNAISTGRAMAGLAAAFARLKTDIVLVVGDRVEAFAAAAAGHIAGLMVAHVHGGDRALGQVDDSLRHAITKLAHLHFPATAASAKRILKLGEDAWRVHQVGSPGIDGIAIQAASREIEGRYALVVLHPTESDESAEFDRARLVMRCVEKIGFDQVIIVYPNNDPGSTGIIRCWESISFPAGGGSPGSSRAGQHRPGLPPPAIKDLSGMSSVGVFRDLPRSRFLALLRDAAVVIGNSSSGIIEAASFGTPVVDIGPRQSGRECSKNVVHVPFDERRITRELRRIWNDGRPIRSTARNVYGGEGTGSHIAQILATTPIDAVLRRKLIAY